MLKPYNSDFCGSCIGKRNVYKPAHQTYALHLQAHQWQPSLCRGFVHRNAFNPGQTANQEAGFHSLEQAALHLISHNSVLVDHCQPVAHGCCLYKPVAPLCCSLLQTFKGLLPDRHYTMQICLQCQHRLRTETRVGSDHVCSVSKV